MAVNEIKLSAEILDGERNWNKMFELYPGLKQVCDTAMSLNGGILWPGTGVASLWPNAGARSCVLKGPHFSIAVSADTATHSGLLSGKSVFKIAFTPNDESTDPTVWETLLGVCQDSNLQTNVTRGTVHFWPKNDGQRVGPPLSGSSAQFEAIVASDRQQGKNPFQWSVSSTGCEM